MEKQWKNCSFDVWPLWSRSTEKKNHGGNEQNRLYGATVGIVEGAFGQALDTLEKSSNTMAKHWKIDEMEG